MMRSRIAVPLVLVIILGVTSNKSDDNTGTGTEVEDMFLDGNAVDQQNVTDLDLDVKKKPNKSPKGPFNGTCFKDTYRRKLLRGRAIHNLKPNSPEICKSICQLGDFKFAGVEAGTNCYCGNRLFLKHHHKASQKSCRTPCPGNRGQFCGGKKKPKKGKKKLYISLYSNGAPDSILLIGGYNEGTLGHTELYPSSDCDIPALPEKRHFHNAFITNFGRVAMCGGRNNSNIPVTDCQVLNSKGWVKDKRIPDLPHPRHRATIATLPSMGTYILGGVDSLNSSLLLKNDARSWVSGPSLPGDGAAYACSVVWGNSFFIIGGGPGEAYTQVQQYSLATGWASEGTWPKLTQERLAHGCSILDDNIIVAGGWYVDKFLDSTEIISLSGKTIHDGGTLTPARGYFIMATVGPSPGTLYAMGGYGGAAGIATLDTVGRWNSISESWTDDTQLIEKNAGMGYLAINKNLMCEIQ